MPYHEYECRRCGEIFEFKHYYGEKPKKRCPECHGKLQKVSYPGFSSFRGTGTHSRGDEKPGGKHTCQVKMEQRRRAAGMATVAGRDFAGGRNQPAA
ncbi:MAG: Zinc ribbon domain protein [bacterium ADurb.Bin236]|nr:MAG: Zinc ribbon domain protein [bacterium ADurb.Bin236]